MSDVRNVPNVERGLERGVRFKISGAYKCTSVCNIQLCYFVLALSQMFSLSDNLALQPQLCMPGDLYGPERPKIFER